MTVVKRAANFQCLRCGHDYEDDYSPQEMRERACPRCSSNSVRRVKKKASLSTPSAAEKTRRERQTEVVRQKEGEDKNE